MKKKNSYVKPNNLTTISGVRAVPFKGGSALGALARNKNRKNLIAYTSNIVNDIKSAFPIKSSIIEPKILPPAIKQWANSIYSFNKNYIKALPAVDTIVNKLIKSFFSINPLQNNPEGKKSKLIQRRDQRSSLNRIFVSKPEIKHSNDKVFITVYLFNKKKKSLFYRLKHLYESIMYNNTITSENKSNTFGKKNRKIMHKSNQINNNRFLRKRYLSRDKKARIVKHRFFQKSFRFIRRSHRIAKHRFFQRRFRFIFKRGRFVKTKFSRRIFKNILFKKKLRLSRISYARLYKTHNKLNSKRTHNKLYSKRTHNKLNSKRTLYSYNMISKRPNLYYIKILNVYPPKNKKHYRFKAKNSFKNYHFNSKKVSHLNKKSNFKQGSTFFSCKSLKDKKLSNLIKIKRNKLFTIYNKLQLFNNIDNNIVHNVSSQTSKVLLNSFKLLKKILIKKASIIRHSTLYVQGGKRTLPFKGGSALGALARNKNINRGILLKNKKEVGAACPLHKRSKYNSKRSKYNSKWSKYNSKRFKYNSKWSKYNSKRSKHSSKRYKYSSKPFKYSSNLRKPISNFLFLYTKKKLNKYKARKSWLRKVRGKRLSCIYIRRVIKNIILLKKMTKIEKFFKKYNKVLVNNKILFNNKNNFNSVVYDNNIASIYKLNYLKKMLSKEFLYLYYVRMLSFNNSLFKSWLLNSLKTILSKIYNKKVILNLISLKYRHLNSDIFTESIIVRLRNNKKNRLNKVLRRALKLVVLSKVNIFSYNTHSSVNKFIEHFYNKFKFLNFDIFKELDLSTKQKYLKSNHSSKVIKGLNTAQANTINFIRHKSVFGVKLVTAGRLTKRTTASRAVFKTRYKGTLRNNIFINRSDSSTIIRNNTISNLQFSKISSKTRNGSFGLKGWLNNN